jgi:hypothetical protein
MMEAAGEQLSPEERAIARTVLFASLFDYPLTLAELRQTLIASAQTPTQIIATVGRSERLRTLVEWRNGFFFPRGRDDLIDTRRQRERLSRDFIARHARYLRIASAMPYVRCVALSGSVAHLNMDGDGDLDLFVVTRGPHAWSVTVALVLLAKAMRCRRVVCANFVMADSRLHIDEPDLFSASQLLHLRPVYGHDTYRLVLAANPFIYQFYPNAHVPCLARPHQIPGPSKLKQGFESVCRVPAAIIETACRWAYGTYLRSRAADWQSPEQVRLEADRLKLHTKSHRGSVMDRFARTTVAL